LKKDFVNYRKQLIKVVQRITSELFGVPGNLSHKLQLRDVTNDCCFGYCHTIWHFFRTSDSRKIERIQERALRAVFCAVTITTELAVAGYCHNDV
jgi:hypothetical protein